MGTDTNSFVQIKYDEIKVKIFAIVSVISFIIFCIGIALIFMEIPGTELLLIFFLYEGVGAGIAGLIGFLSGKAYFRRLKVYGYEIPHSKKAYNNILDELPRDEANSEYSYFAKYSTAGMWACYSLWGVFMLMEGAFFIKWKFMLENCRFVAVMNAILFLLWIVMGLVLKKQSNKDKYRDDVEKDSSRKIRWSPERISVSIVILALVSIFAYSMGSNMLEYIFRTNIAADIDRVEDIKRVIEHTLEDNEESVNTVSFEQICDGVEITNWGEPSDALQKDIADGLNISDFSELKNEFRMSDDDACVQVKIEDGNVIVTLLNPIKEVGKYGKIRNEIKTY